MIWTVLFWIWLIGVVIAFMVGASVPVDGKANIRVVLAEIFSFRNGWHPWLELGVLILLSLLWPLFLSVLVWFGRELKEQLKDG